MEIELHQLEKKYTGLRIAGVDRRARLVSSLAEHGQQQPVLVVRAGGGGGGGGAEAVERYVLIDGYARVAALAELKRDSVEATVLELSEAQALLLAFRLESNGGRSAIEQAWLLRELTRRHGIAQRDLGALVGRSASWVCRRLGLIEALPEVVEDAVRAGQVPAQAAMKYLVPLARANCAQCERLMLNLGRRRMSVRQTARLYAAWRAGNAEQRQAIVERPLLYLELEEKQTESELVDEGEAREHRLLRDLGMLAGVCRRARQAIREREKELPWPAVLRYAWQEAQASFAALIEVVVEGGPFDVAQDRHA